jgi:hypothetical protein
MNVYIWKYRAEHNYSFSNYFRIPVLIDKIKVSEVLRDSIPIYEERLEKQDSVFEFTAGDFDVRLSLLSKARSLHGSTLKDFLLPNETVNVFFICVVEFGGATDPGCKRIGGRIDLNSIEADLTITRNNYNVQFKVTGIMKELADILSLTPLSHIGSAYTLEIFISGCLNPEPMPAYLGNSTRIIWDERVGFTPVLMKEVYNNVLDNAGGAGITKWNAFKELAKGFGFVFRADVLYRGDLFTLDYPCFGVTTFWRDRHSGDKELKFKSEIQRYSDWNTFKNYLIVTHRSNILGKDNEYEGMLAVNDGNVYVADGVEGSVFEEMIFDKSSAVIMAVIGETPPVISSDSATIINLPTYATGFSYIVDNDNGTDLISHRVSFMSMFCHTYTSHSDPIHNRHWVFIHGFKTLMQRTIGEEYKYFVAGVNKAVEFDIVFDNDTKLNIYDSINVEGVRYYCKAIRNINLIEQTAKTEWVQI